MSTEKPQDFVGRILNDNDFLIAIKKMLVCVFGAGGYLETRIGLENWDSNNFQREVHSDNILAYS